MIRALFLLAIVPWSTVGADTEVYVGVGGTVSLPCPYKGRLSPRFAGAVVWSFSPQLGDGADVVARAWAPEVEPDSRIEKFEGAVDLDLMYRQKADLEIKRYSIDMSGEFVCRVKLESEDGSPIPDVIHEYSVKTARISAPKLLPGDPIVAREDVEVVVQCIATGVPLPDVTWFVAGRRATPTSGETPSPDEIRSTLSLSPDRRMNGRTVRCSVENAATKTVDDGRPLAVDGSLYVRYSPSAPQIALDPTLWLPASSLFTAACNVADLGNPPGVLRMTTPDGRTKLGGSPGATVVQTSFQVQPNHDESEINCFVDSEVSSSSSSATIRVAFGPNGVDIDGEDDVVAGEDLTLTCHPRNVNPRPEVIWESPRSHPITPTTWPNSFTNSSFNSVILRPTWRNNGAEIHCVVRNVHNMIEKSDHMKLIVYHAPMWTSPAPYRRIPARINETVTLECNVSANPPPDGYSWTKEQAVDGETFGESELWRGNGEVEESNGTVIGDERMLLIRTNEESYGHYFCKTWNAYGTKVYAVILVDSNSQNLNVSGIQAKLILMVFLIVFFVFIIFVVVITIIIIVKRNPKCLAAGKPKRRRERGASEMSAIRSKTHSTTTTHLSPSQTNSAAPLTLAASQLTPSTAPMSLSEADVSRGSTLSLRGSVDEPVEGGNANGGLLMTLDSASGLILGPQFPVGRNNNFQNGAHSSSPRSNRRQAKNNQRANGASSPTGGASIAGAAAFPSPNVQSLTIDVNAAKRETTSLGNGSNRSNQSSGSHRSNDSDHPLLDGKRGEAKPKKKKKHNLFGVKRRRRRSQAGGGGKGESDELERTVI